MTKKGGFFDFFVWGGCLNEAAKKTPIFKKKRKKPHFWG